MSFILDALKKSEVERQRQAIPGLMDSRPVPPRARFPLWAAALIALLVVNMGVLAVVLTRGGAHSGAPSTSSLSAPAPATPGAAGSTTPAPAPGPSGSASDHFSPMDAAPPVYAPEIPPTEDLSSPPTARRAARGASSNGGVSHRAAQQADPLLTDSNDSSDSEVLPSINEIDLASQPALAGLHLDVHVYATKPAERFVYINMRKYREGATLAEGPVLEHIRRDGVVLNYQGLRFVLPRQQ
ncbi:MAG: general secretion pathway protein GspB [Steroidobacteraceae bacterium]|jgi:general secretion pathway protein B